jgi:hypothetical protein
MAAVTARVILLAAAADLLPIHLAPPPPTQRVARLRSSKTHIILTALRK